MTGRTDGTWSSAGYYVCSHFGCKKKVNPAIADHDCCGRCRQGHDCLYPPRARAPERSARKWFR